MDVHLNKDVIRACQKGDKTAYATLVKKHYKDVYALCLGMLGNVHDAEDATQEAMLRSILRIRSLDKSEQFESWICKIARNICIDLLRRQKLIRAFAVSRSEQSDTKACNSNDLERAIRRLPKELRVPLIMFYFDGKNARNIADKLSISHSGACRKLRSARRQLHQLLLERTKHEQ